MPERLYEEILPVIMDEGERWAGRERLGDVVQACLAGLALVCLLPLLGLVALAVKLTSPGPILYRGARVGKDGRIFTIYKFRTLDDGAEGTIGARLLDERDHYYTPIGRLLKRTKLDELPQLWNVLRGDMSLVGPRPEMPFIVRSYDSVHLLRLQARPGLTGLWQISKMRLLPIHDGIAYDLFYLANRSLAFDLWILYRTPLLLLFGRQISINEQLIDRWSQPALEREPPTVVLDISDSAMAPRLELDLTTERVPP
jgi:lipopolysaccharide/colanic/teichoic acid biosynthesis glycosyltransferase